MYSKYTGIILKKHPLGEASELLTIFTRESGKIRVKAVSSRKIQSRLGGHLQSLNEVEFEIAGRSASGGLPVLISVRTTMLNNYLRENLKKFAYALIGVETLYRLSADQEENGEAYLALTQFLKELDESMNEKVSLRRFQVRLLRVMGFGFDMTQPAFSENSLGEIQALSGGKKPGQISVDAERAIDQFIGQTVEREIKSEKFLRQVT